MADTNELRELALQLKDILGGRADSQFLYAALDMLPYFEEAELEEVRALVRRYADASSQHVALARVEADNAMAEWKRKAERSLRKNENAVAAATLETQLA